MSSNLVETAQQIATHAHVTQERFNKLPYITHPAAVVDILKSWLGPFKENLKTPIENYLAAGWLHDVIEDSKITADGLREAGIPEEVVHAVVLLTHKKDDTYLDYLLGLSLNNIAFTVKKADVIHNMIDLEPGSRYDKYVMAKWILNETHGRKIDPSLTTNDIG